MNNFYLLSDSLDWADEFDVYFFEIVNESTYKKYMYTKEILDTLEGSFYFGTNEGWDYDFNYLRFDLIPIPEEDVKVLSKYNIPGEDIMYRFFEKLEEFISENTPGVLDDDVFLDDISFEEFKIILNKFKESV